MAIHVKRYGKAIVDRVFYEAKCQYCKAEFLCEEEDMQRHTSKSDASDLFFTIKCPTPNCQNILYPIKTSEKPEVILEGKE